MEGDARARGRGGTNYAKVRKIDFPRVFRVGINLGLHPRVLRDQFALEKNLKVNCLQTS